ncbi:hypothetical protein HNR65_002970 [Desulfosalsimonas propionicica]|uniref:DUF456 domain-containing protein n=1 Tax=Desulfosalsimonas propionicica TaxID=332175 RepID=A0A7W0CBD7_9BACT|nr:DUF456 domain-containing protein [Desulfosalsimonas propionicica]MBA2882616.1 hypothetical protein [Desulfosalsimonas propionicica]
MEIAGMMALFVLILCCIAGIVLVPLGMPGTFVILAGAVFYNLIQGAMVFSLLVLALLLGLAIVGEVLEYILGVSMATKRGASRRAAFGGIVGGIVGAFAGVPVFLIGPVIGLFAGVFIGAFVVELAVKKDAAASFRSATGAFYGRVGATLVKTLIGITMVVVLCMQVF